MSHKTILLLHVRIVYLLYSHITLNIYKDGEKRVFVKSLPKSSTDNSAKYVKKLLDGTNIKIISELIRQQDISIYNFNYKAFGGRVGDLIVNVDKGKSKEIAQSLLKKYKDNIMSCDTRINSQHNCFCSCSLQGY